MIRYLITSVLFVFFSIHQTFTQTTYQAEDAYIHKGIFEDKNAGFTGPGYVNGDNEVGSFVEWVVSTAEAGTQTLTFYYANGTDQDRAMELMLNGEILDTPVSFPGTGDFTSWATTEITLDLLKGKNLVRLTAITENGGPNLDKLIVSGEKGPDFYKVTTNVIGEGQVFILQNDSIFEEGTNIRVLAEAETGFQFYRWRGDVRNTEDSLDIIVDKAYSFTAVFAEAGIQLNDDLLMGWATVDGCLTGGSGGEVRMVTNQQELQSAVAGGDAPMIIKIVDTIHVTPFGYEIPIRSNKTIIGMGEGAVIKGGGFKIQNAENIIIRNLHITDAFVDFDGKTTDNDAIEINNSKYIWIDHCDFSRFDDGLIDIKTGSDFVTVSWCHFFNHNKVMLIGAGDNVPQDVGHLNVTVHHNWFDGEGGIGLHQRVPRVRYGKVHVFNNYYNKIQIRGPLAAIEADLLVERNYFQDTKDPHPAQGGVGDNKLKAVDNIYINSSGRKDSKLSGLVFDPTAFYPYEMDEVEDVPLLVLLGAGRKSFADNEAEAVQCFEGSTAIEEIPVSIIQDLRVFPNPGYGKTMVSFHLKERLELRLDLINANGQRISNIFHGDKLSGEYAFPVNTDNLSPGVYFLTFTSNARMLTRRMVVK